MKKVTERKTNKIAIFYEKIDYEEDKSIKFETIKRKKA